MDVCRGGVRVHNSGGALPRIQIPRSLIERVARAKDEEAGKQVPEQDGEEEQSEHSEPRNVNVVAVLEVGADLLDLDEPNGLHQPGRAQELGRLAQLRQLERCVPVRQSVVIRVEALQHFLRVDGEPGQARHQVRGKVAGGVVLGDRQWVQNLVP